MSDDVFAQALIFIKEIKESLARGTKHYHPKTGELLTTEKKILECLLSTGTVLFHPPEINNSPQN